MATLPIDISADYSDGLKAKFKSLQGLQDELIEVQKKVAKIDGGVADKIAQTIGLAVSSFAGFPIVLPNSIALLGAGWAGPFLILAKRKKLKPLLLKVDELSKKIVELNNEIVTQVGKEELDILAGKQSNGKPVTPGSAEPQGSENDDLIDTIGRSTGLRSATDPKTSRYLIIGGLGLLAVFGTYKYATGNQVKPKRSR
jgi:hypothetical protein